VGPLTAPPNPMAKLFHASGGAVHSINNEVELSPWRALSQPNVLTLWGQPPRLSRRSPGFPT